MRPIHRAASAAVIAMGLLPLAGLAGEAPSPPAGQEFEARLREARERMEMAAREMAELSSQIGRRINMQIGVEAGAPRALIGVSVDGSGGREGARVVSVSPGGPAAEAGIQAGDTITSIAGSDLTRDSDPSRALVERMRQVEPNLKLEVQLLRDGRKMSFDVTPRPAPQTFAFSQALPAPGLRTFEVQTGPNGRPLVGIDGSRGGPGNRIVVSGALPELFGGEPGQRFEDMEFATLSERLGSYFGVKAGVLVVRAGQDSRYKLQDGDVILAIDGREVATAQHAGRVLRSYQPGEKATLRVQRDRKATDLEITAPGAGRR